MQDIDVLVDLIYSQAEMLHLFDLQTLQSQHGKGIISALSKNLSKLQNELRQYDPSDR